MCTVGFSPPVEVTAPLSRAEVVMILLAPEALVSIGASITSVPQPARRKLMELLLKPVPALAGKEKPV
jgi:hypothetical protein